MGRRMELLPLLGGLPRLRRRPSRRGRFALLQLRQPGSGRSHSAGPNRRRTGHGPASARGKAPPPCVGLASRRAYSAFEIWASSLRRLPIFPVCGYWQFKLAQRGEAETPPLALSDGLGRAPRLCEELRLRAEPTALQRPQRLQKARAQDRCLWPSVLLSLASRGEGATFPALPSELRTPGRVRVGPPRS